MSGPHGADAGPAGADVLAAGAVLWRPTGDAAGPDAVGVGVDVGVDVRKVELALVHRPRYDDWSFPKGKLDAGETMAGAAVREVREETGSVARLGHVVGDVRYSVPEGRKLVRYWSARAVPGPDGSDGPFVPGDETDELRWVSPEEAEALLSYAHDVEVLRRFVAVGLPGSVVLLVRHAKAGSRHGWTGDDDLRPLSGAGREQAAELAALLPLFGPSRLFTAPPVRCVDTVGPTAARLGLPVGVEPLLGEDGYWDDPDAGLARLREIAAAAGVTAVCSQGGVIPDVVGALAAAAGARRLGVDPDDVPSKKGSTWVLGFRDGALLTADHYPPPAGRDRRHARVAQRG